MRSTGKRNIRAMLKLMESKGYKVYERPYELNIVGVRNNSVEPNKFDDDLYVFWKDEKGVWQGKIYRVTTDPGTYWLKNPMSKLGTAILKEGQYVDAYKSGLHLGQYRALVQSKPVTVLRDYDRNAILDFSNGKEETGIFGINIHRSSATGTAQSVDKWSAGCQVFENGNEFTDFMKLVDNQEKLYGNKFTYTLVDERAYNRFKRRAGLGVLVVVVLGIAFFGYKKYKSLN